MGRIIILHFQPVEMYPPIMNFLRILADAGVKVDVITTNCSVPEYKVFNPSDEIRIRRYGTFRQSMNVFSKLFNYGVYYLLSFLSLAVKRPGKVLYYETLSALPVYLYNKSLNKNAEVFIHYHEYTSPQEYMTGMSLVKYMHSKEIFLYNRCHWISHTNSERLDRFLIDEQIPLSKQAKVWPNYPPANWVRHSAKELGSPIRFVYLGALSFDTMFIEEFIRWINCEGNESTLDVYTTNIPDTSRQRLMELSGSRVKLMGGVDYDEIPSVLIHYDVGLILYKGHIPNYVYNAPNKLFEYHACGLDVWYPSVMAGCDSYATDRSYPKIAAVDFEMLSDLDLDSMMSRVDLEFKPSVFTAEKVCEEMVTELVGTK